MKIAAILLILIIVGAGDIISSMAATIASSVSVVNQKQTGSTTCTMTITPTCSVTVTFPASFSTAPKMITQVMNSGTGVTRALPSGNLVFESDAGTSWVGGMPAAKTELYGNTLHEASADASFQTGMSFSVNCITPSTSATAILRPEYSIDQGASWHELSTNPGFLDMDISGNGLACNFGGQFPFTVGPFGTQTNSTTTATAFRVVGKNGNGVADVPKFNNIELTYYVTFQLIATSRYSSVTATSFMATCDVVLQQSVSNFVCMMNWQGEIA